MPYFIYKVLPGKCLEKITHFEDFKGAKTYAREHRAAQKPADNYTVKIIFAADEIAAEQELSQHREAPILMEHEK